MEQIVITRKDGTTYPLTVKREGTAIKEARQSWSLLGDDVVNVAVESPYPQRYEIGDYFSVFGRTYKLNQLPRVRKDGAHKFTYELTFEGVQYDLLRVFYDVTIETTSNTLQDVQGDALTGDLKRFATVLVSNANRVFPSKWALGACPETVADKTLTFGDGDNCLAVFQNLCRTFDVEADIIQQGGVCVINFHKRVGSTHPFVFEFGKGKGLYTLDRQNVDSSNIVTRLKVFGSSDNITNKYRANRLCLPGKGKAQSFIEDEDVVRKYGIHEARKIFEDIKPVFNGEVTAIVSGSALQFKDNGMFDLNAKEADGKTTKHLVAGVGAKIHFNTGNLAGYEFDIHKYDHTTRTFSLKKLIDDRGAVFPSETSSAFRFAVGDKYKILDVTLPEQYQIEAERKLEEQAIEYYRQNSQPKVKYGLSVAQSYLKRWFGVSADVTLFSPGDYINIKDESIGVDKAVRIQSLQRSLMDVYDYTLTLSDVAENNITTRVISELIEIDKITTAHQLKDPIRARANWRSSREVMNMVFDADGDYYTDKIKPNSIDTLALSVGAKSMQFSLQDVIFEPNYQGQKNTVRVSAGTLTHYTIEEQPRVWHIAQVVASLSEDDSAYYIFARCSRVGNEASIVFSKTPIQAEQEAGAYNFWVGVVNSVDVELQARSLSLSYGFSMINGRFIKTGRIESADGSTYIDLDEAEIGGNIKFRGFDNQSRTEVSGGLLLTEALLLRDKNGSVTTLLNGREQLRGSYTPKGIAFASGIKNFATPTEKRNVEIWHSGLARFGDIVLDPDGAIRYYTDGDLKKKPYMVLGGKAETELEHIQQDDVSLSLVEEYRWVGDLDGLTDASSPREAVYRSVEFAVQDRSPSIRIVASARLESEYINAGGALSISPVRLYRARDRQEIALKHVDGNTLWESRTKSSDYQQSEGKYIASRELGVSLNPSVSLDTSALERYYIEVAILYEPRTISTATMSLMLKIINVGSLVLGKRANMYIGEYGIMALYSKRHWLALQQNGYILSAQGRVNLPGVLLSGYVSGDTVVRTSGGKRYYELRNLYNPLGLDVACYDFGTDGYYAITHNANVSSLLPQITVVGKAGVSSSMQTTAVVAHISSVGFQVWVTNKENGVLRQDFIFTLVGNNY